jgi:2-hydroxy-3-keto-5-methylthiopentenyl-1-phosphate phosphatase
VKGEADTSLDRNPRYLDQVVPKRIVGLNHRVIGAYRLRKTLFALAVQRDPIIRNELTRRAYNRYRFFLWGVGPGCESNSYMADKPLKRYIFASDFDQTLTFNDSGYVLAELVGIPTEDFERKAKGMAKINLVQQGAELAYLLLHDPEFKTKVRKEHLREVGKRIRLKGDIKLLYQLLDAGIDGHRFDFYVLSAAPVEVILSALEDIVPPDHIFGTEFRYKPSGEIDSIVRATAGYGKVAVLNNLLVQQVSGPDHVIYTGDGSSDIHVMLHINSRDGLTIAVSESADVSQIAKRTVLSTSALAVLAPILEEVAGWERYRIRSFFEANGMLIQEWQRVRTDWLTVRPAADPEQIDGEPAASTLERTISEG